MALALECLLAPELLFKEEFATAHWLPCIVKLQLKGYEKINTQVSALGGQLRSGTEQWRTLQNGTTYTFRTTFDEISVGRYAGGGRGKKGDKQINCKYLKCIVNCRTELTAAQVLGGDNRKEGRSCQLQTIRYN